MFLELPQCINRFDYSKAMLCEIYEATPGTVGTWVF